MTPNWYVPRRTILWGMGAGVALPFLEAMVPRSSGRAAALDPGMNPRRFCGIWGLPCGQVGKVDAQNCKVAPWTPDDPAGPGSFPLTKPDPTGFLAPFFGQSAAICKALQGKPFRDVSSKLSVLTGLSDISQGHPFVAALLGPGRVLCPGACGACGDFPDVRGPSADQVAAKYLARYTPEIPSLVIGTHPASGEGGANEIYRQFLSWKNGMEPLHKEIDPLTVFDTLFGSGGVSPKEDKAAAEQRKRYRKSVLDTVNSQARRLQGRVGRQDKERVQQYLDSIREIELQGDQLAAASCASAPVRPGSDDPAVVHAHYFDNLDERVKLMMDLMVKAFECDRTRVATLTCTNAYGSGGGWPFLTYPGTSNRLRGYHHDMSHYHYGERGGATEEEARAYMNVYGKWVLQMLAYFMGELDRRIDVDGNTLLDNSVVFLGGDSGDADDHSWASMNVLVGGRGGRSPSGNWAIRGGRHVRCSPPWQGSCGDGKCATSEIIANGPPPIQYPGERSTKDLLWAMLDIVGVPPAESEAWVARGGIATKPLTDMLSL